MQKFNSVDELVNTIRPVDPVYCIRPNSIKSACGWFKSNFPGKILYAVKTNPNEEVIKQQIQTMFTIKKEFKDHQHIQSEPNSFHGGGSVAL